MRTRGKPEITIADQGQTSATLNLNYKDTWHVALGAQIQVAQGWLLSTGVSYDSSMISDQRRTPSLPVGAALRFAAGIQHPVSESVELGFAYEFLWGGTLPLDQNRGPLSGGIAGAYNSTFLNFFALNVNWKL